jgi:phosphatidylglycerophosphate synthase
MTSILSEKPYSVVPSIITVFGACATVAGLVQHWWWLLVVGLLCDVADGAIARQLRVESEAGARLDWSLDVMLMGAMVALLEPALLITGVGVISMAILGGWKFSGRALASAVLILSWHF